MRGKNCRTAILLIEPPRDGAWHMAVDAELWATHTDARPPVLRLFRWRRPTVSLGRHQRPDEVIDPAACHRLEVDVVHRPTGGAAVLHHREVTYSIIGTPQQLGVRTPQEAYARIAEALLEGLRSVGVREARMVPIESPIRVQGFCFAATAHCEIAVHGRKLVGSAQRWGRHALLQHGSLLLDFDFNYATVFRPGLFRRVFTTLRDLLGWVPPWDAVADAIATGFARTFGWTWVEASVPPVDLYEVRRRQAQMEIRFDAVSPTLPTQ